MTRQDAAGAVPLTSRRRSCLREVQSNGRHEIELVTNTGPLVASVLAASGSLYALSSLYDRPLMYAGGFTVLAAVVVTWTAMSWAFRRVVRLAVTRDGLVIESRHDRTVMLLAEVGEIRGFRYAPTVDAYGVDVVRKDGTRVEVRAWNPSAEEVNLAVSRLTYLVEHLRSENPYRT